jgi:chaperonin GroES
MALKPLHDRVLVRRVESDEKTSGGLIIPDSAKEKPAEGVIVACGEGARKDSGELIAMAVKDGDKVLFGKWSGRSHSRRRRAVDDERERYFGHFVLIANRKNINSLDEDQHNGCKRRQV